MVDNDNMGRTNYRVLWHQLLSPFLRIVALMKMLNPSITYDRSGILRARPARADPKVNWATWMPTGQWRQ
jgi:hypothetical protein